MKEVSREATEDAHRPYYVVSQDIMLLLEKWCRVNGFTLPDKVFFDALRKRMFDELQRIFPQARVIMISEEEIVGPLHDLLSKSVHPVISLDRVYTHQQFNLDYTRLVDERCNYIGLCSRTQDTIAVQMDRIVHGLSGKREVQIVDDVIFSGDGIIDVVKWFNERGIRISKVVAGVSVGGSIEKVVGACVGNNPGMSVESVFHFDDVLDEICERDFYPGVPLSGRLVGVMSEDGAVPVIPEMGAPYLLPHGNPQKWASIPENEIREWSRFCLGQAHTLWRIVERLSDREVLCGDLSRRPLYAPDDVSVVALLSSMMKAV